MRRGAQEGNLLQRMLARKPKNQIAEAIMPDKGKVERPLRFVPEDFFLGGLFHNLNNLNE